MHVLMVTPEATPFAQTGGLGEVMSALPAELISLGADVEVFMPKYRNITPEKFPNLKKTDFTVEISLNAKPVKGRIWELIDERKTRYLFLECDEFFDRDYLYGTPDGDYEDNAERFVFLTRAALEMALLRRKHFDIYHVHDWQAALTPVYLRTLYAGEKLFEDSAAIMTIHNLGYQGIFWHLDMPLVGVGWEFFTPKHMEFYGKLNFLKSGIVFSDEVNTVSPGYRNEILTPEFGFGLEGVLQEKGARLSGILNGVDYSIWNPETDQFIAARYGADDLSGKALCKADLQNIAGLPELPDVPVISMVTRLSSQKGVDILAAALPTLIERDLQFVLLGSGDARYQQSFQEFARDYPDKIAAFLAYDYRLSHKIFAGSDILLVPSRYEPCGLNQLYGLKYGTVPIVRVTGGLTDTVEQFNPEMDTGTGFRFVPPDSDALIDAISKAVNVYTDMPDAWTKLMRRGMARDFSWKRSAHEYLKLYERARTARMDYLNQFA
ncbi:glycogen synthase GlgA [Desulfomonile tiedjei]|uniref:Glycogen synthase n=1 Tax=Desulfomonile tiedjei (strain ATCC 49306 / DSM 6799 / DCB-1) TaxID=706587 RepID=I4C115_DESTA|nr:glycogen synthase GlgA [Desulfomonile tiedjei]AFM23256.1 glycogen/starch synthase, ADP-glucose type [Desulfomonile tiedjei DSM 6799]